MIKQTNDGSQTIYSEQFKQTYHSTSGAIEESLHVFINNGFNFLQKQEITIFELGFGTGLNAFLTFIEAEKRGIKVNYITVEKYPVEQDYFSKLNYHKFFDKKYSKFFEQIHTVEWENNVVLNYFFNLTKVKADFLDFKFENNIDLVYFDAFSYDSQPEMWSVGVFTKIFKAMNNNSILVTYSAKGIIKQNMRAAGFKIKRLKGAGNKWHMIRATKISD